MFSLPFLSTCDRLQTSPESQHHRPAIPDLSRRSTTSSCIASHPPTDRQQLQHRRRKLHQFNCNNSLFCNYKRLSNENGIANRLGTWHGSPSTRTASHCILHSIPTGLQHLVDAPLSLTTTTLHPTTLKGSRTKSSQWIVMKPTEDVHHIEDQQLEPSDRLRHASNASSSTPSHRQLRRAAAQPPVY